MVARSTCISGSALASPQTHLTRSLFDFGLRDIERGAGGVVADYLEAAVGQQKGKSACSATDIQDAMSTELFRDSNVYIEVGPVGVERFIDRGQPRMLEYGISHAANNGRKFAKYQSIYDAPPNSTPPDGSTRSR